MKIGIVGWGVEGQSAFRFFGPDNDYLIVNEEPRDDFPAETDRLKVRFVEADRTPGITSNVSDLSYLNGLADCDKIIYTPTSFPNLQKKYKDQKDFWPKTTSIWHIFFEEVKTKNLIGVTGTKGKGTTSSLIYELLKAQGKNVFLGGNIGTAVLDFVKNVGPEDWVVLEMANFQLYNLTYSPHIAVCLMIVPEHMDWHKDMSEYLEAKANIFRHQKTDDAAIFFADNQYSAQIAQYSPGRKIPFYKPPGAFVREDGKIIMGDQEIIDRTEVKLLGEHNLQNICAACTAVFESVGSLDKAKTVLSSFSGLEHRLELVRELDGVKYYDDSFGTSPETAIVAVKAFSQPKIMILGGSDKGAEFGELATAVKASGVKHTIVIGKIADKIVSALRQAGFENITTGLTAMPEIAQKARELAQPGDVVLLSAAAASFGLFKDYKDRGNQFKQAVLELS
jgi:UDP-N-acetylmuramoylalanine--D-glutamate ligase